MPSASETFISSPRAFVRSLNLLLKLTQLYGSSHVQTAAQLEDTWSELRSALESTGPGGLVIGTSGAELLVDGISCDASEGERRLLQFLNEADISSIAFTRDLKKHSFARFARMAASANLRPGELVRRMKSAFGTGEAGGIRVNEIRFVAAGSEAAKQDNSEVADADSEHGEIGKPRDWLRDPEKLIRVIAAAEAAGQNKTSGFEFGEELLGGTARDSEEQREVYAVTESEMGKLLRLTVRMSEATHEEDGHRGGMEWNDRFATLTPAAQATLKQALADVAPKLTSRWLDDAAMLQLGEDLAVGYARECFRSGKLRADNVRELLERLSQEIEPLRDSHRWRRQKRKSAKAAAQAEPHVDILERQFWATIPAESKQSVLLAEEAWCVPAENIQEYANELLRRGDSQTADNVLANYADCVSNRKVEARKKTAAGLNALADLYTQAAGRRLDGALRAIGEQLAAERDAEAQSLLAAAFVRFMEEAAARHSYPGLWHALDALASLDRSFPTWTKSLRPRIGVNNRVPEFIEEGLQAEVPKPELVEVLRRLPQASADYLAGRLMRVARSGERERVVGLAQAIGQPASRHLQQTLEHGAATKAVRVAGLLSRIEPGAVEKLLPEKIEKSGREVHDETLRQLSVAGAPERGKVLVSLLERLDAMIVPMALDEIGMSGDASLAPELVRLAEGDLLPDGADFLRIKAVEALGRLREPSSVPHLRRFIEERRAWRYAYPAEMRLAAAQALLKLDPEQARDVLPESGLDASQIAHAPLDARPDRGFIRFRRYPRIRLTRPVSAVIQARRGKYEPEVQVLSLEGGLLTGKMPLAVGTAADLKISAGLRPIRTEVLVRFSTPNQAGVEMVGMDLEDRRRLRSLLVSMTATPDAVENQPLFA